MSLAVVGGFASGVSGTPVCEGVFCNNPGIIYNWLVPEEDHTWSDKTFAECQEFCVLDEQNVCVAVRYIPHDNTCERFKSIPGTQPQIKSENVWTYVPSLGESIQFAPSELQQVPYHTTGVTSHQCQGFMVQTDFEEFYKRQGRLIARWTPEQGAAQQFVQAYPYFARPAMSLVTVAYKVPPAPVLNATSGPISANQYLQMTQEPNPKGDLVVSLTEDFSQATKFEFSELGGIKKGSHCLRLAKASGMHPMDVDGDAAHVQDTPKCSQFLPDGLPSKGKPDEWKMTVQGNDWCLAAPDQGSLKAVKVGNECSPNWQMSPSGVGSGSGQQFENVDATGTCELFVQKTDAVRSEPSSATTCPNMDGMWNVHYFFRPGTLDYKAKIQVSGNVGTLSIEEDTLVYHFAIDDECHRIRFCMTPLVNPEEVTCTSLGTFFEGTLDSAGNTISWDDDAYPEWTNALPLHNKCPNMDYYACATGPLNATDHRDFKCAFAPNYKACDDYCKEQETECHFCSDGSCVSNMYII